MNILKNMYTWLILSVAGIYLFIGSLILLSAGFITMQIAVVGALYIGAPMACVGCGGALWWERHTIKKQ